MSDDTVGAAGTKAPDARTAVAFAPLIILAGGLPSCSSVARWSSAACISACSPLALRLRAAPN